MPNDLQSHIAFYLTGKRTGDALDPVEGLGLGPALLAGYRDLTQLRYDFPVVLGTRIESLRAVFDGALATLEAGPETDKIRKTALKLEREIRTLAAKGKTGRLSVLWDEAAKHIPNAKELGKLRSAIGIDGDVIDCDRGFAGRMVLHAWTIAQEKKGRAFRARIDRLVLCLNNILRADQAGSNAGRSADRLRASFGGGAASVIDFDAMSEILTKAVPESKISGSRRQRIRWAHDTLSKQSFYEAGGKPGLDFVFSSCARALQAYQMRLPQAAELAKAIAITQLEIAGDYNEAKHDRIFKDFGANGLDPRDLADLPDYLVRLDTAKMSASEVEHLVELLAAGLPIKVMVQTDDILQASPLSENHLAIGGRARQLAQAAMGMTDVFVLQTPASNLIRAKESLVRGLNYAGPALFSVFSGAGAESRSVAPYLVGAAALESRAFPAFAYDPSAGRDWASRFSLDGNSQADLDWPVQTFLYEDESLQRVSDELSFTLADFVALDHRFQRHFARVPKASWNGSLTTLTDTLRSQSSILNPQSSILPEKTPCLLMVDERGHLQKVLVSDALVRESARCLEMWHSLQELGGIHNSHAQLQLEYQQVAFEERLSKELAARKPEPVAATVAVPAPDTQHPAPAASEASVPVPVEEQRNTDEAYIETPRCTSCNECTQVNNKMFAYNENKQARIADLSAGTYRQLVEAAESCQVSIIHPGKPRNPNEPGLDDLIKRAEPFL